ncbi:MAG: exonuclease domain-containing protein [Actinomycetes bacterium]
MAPLAVIDCETTGLSSRDRIIEIAVVLLEPTTLEVVDEYDTLVNPERDVGPVHIHGISASMVEAAPTFAEIAGELADRLDGSVLVAHNLPFDTRMVRSELDRLDATFVEGAGICTLRLSGSRLSKATAEHGIPLDDHHRALADARASAALLRALQERIPPEPTPARIRGDLRRSFRTLRRDAFALDGASVLARFVAEAESRTGSFDRAYLETLDWMLDDFDLDGDEWGALTLLAHRAGASSADVAELHERYLDAFIAASRRDGVVSDLEHATLRRLADLLDVPAARVPEADVLPTIDALRAGMGVCFTGTAVDARGDAWARDRLEEVARAAGLHPVASVTRSGCDLLVAADPSSSSGKTRRARDYEVPVIGVDEFLDLTGARPTRT